MNWELISLAVGIGMVAVLTAAAVALYKGMCAAIGWGIGKWVEGNFGKRRR